MRTLNAALGLVIRSQMEMDDMKKPAEQRTRFSFKCSFLELYNEAITDLLRPSSVNLQVRPAAVSVAVGTSGVAGAKGASYNLLQHMPARAGRKSGCEKYSGLLGRVALWNPSHLRFACELGATFH